MSDKLILMKEALEILRQKQYVSELGFRKWLMGPHSRHFVKPVWKKHGTLKWRKFKRSEILKLRALLPADRVNGKEVFPRREK